MPIIVYYCDIKLKITTLRETYRYDTEKNIEKYILSDTNFHQVYIKHLSRLVGMQISKNKKETYIHWLCLLSFN